MRAARRYILLFAVLTIIYHSNLRPVASGDSLPAALIPFSLWLDGSIALNRFGPWMDRQVPYGRDVLIEIALVPVVLAFAATLIGLAWVIFG